MEHNREGMHVAFKAKYLAFILLLGMIFSAAVCEGEYRNLLLGGINEEKPVCDEPCSSYVNANYKEIASDLNAYYFPMYYGSQGDNIDEVQKAATGDATDENGLTNAALHGTENNPKEYDTIIAYSGGTATALTALANYDEYRVKCNTLILVSPMAAAIGEGYEQFTEVATSVATVVGATVAGTGTALASASNPASALATPVTVPTATVAGGTVTAAVVGGGLAKAADIKANSVFEDQIKTILKNNPDLKIIVIQAPDKDKPSMFSGLYQYTFDEEDKAFEEYKGRIQVINADAELTSTGEQAHKDLFFNYAKTHLSSNTDGGAVEFHPEDHPDAAKDDTKSDQLASKLGIGAMQWQEENPADSPQSETAKSTDESNAVESFGVRALHPGTDQQSDVSGTKEVMSIRKMHQSAKPYGEIAQPIETAKSTDESSLNGNSIVGKWNVIQITTPHELFGGSIKIQFVATFDEDGSVNRPRQQQGRMWIDASTGRWTQNGNDVKWTIAKVTHEGDIQGDHMSGVIYSSGGTSSWSAERLG